MDRRDALDTPCVSGEYALQEGGMEFQGGGGSPNKLVVRLRYNRHVLTIQVILFQSLSSYKGLKKFSLCLNSKGLREKMKDEKGTEGAPPVPFSLLYFALPILPFLSQTF